MVNRMRNEILFTYANARRHAQVVDVLPETIKDKNFIGMIDGYEIYSTKLLIDSFSFVAIKKK